MGGMLCQPSWFLHPIKLWKCRVGYLHWVQIKTTKIKTTKKSTKMDIIMCVRWCELVWMRWFSTVFLPSFGFCREELLCQYTKYQRTHRDAPKLSESRLAVLFTSGIFHPQRQSWYFRKNKALHTKGRLGHCCTNLLHHSVSFLCFAGGACPSTGRVWSECYTFVPRK